MKRLLVRHLPPAAVIAILANALGLIVIGFLGFGWYERQLYERANERPYLEYLNLPFPTLESAVQVGHAVRLVVKRRNNDVQAHIYAVVSKLVSDTDPNQAPIILAFNMAPVEPGDTEWTSAINVIPPNTPLGTYHIEGMAEVPGVYRSFIIPWRSQSFHVVGVSY